MRLDGSGHAPRITSGARDAATQTLGWGGRSQADATRQALGAQWERGPKPRLCATLRSTDPER